MHIRTNIPTGLNKKAKSKSNSNSKSKIANKYYDEYHGHKVKLLEQLRHHLVEQGYNRFIYLAGDSSLDNKYWIDDYSECPKYKHIIPQCKQDVCFWLNQKLKRNKKTVVINCAVEESTIEDRHDDRLLPQDEFIASHITSKDVLIISVGGNDIALKPTFSTMAHLALLMLCPTALLKYHPSYKYFVNFVKNGIQNYIDQLCVYEKPSKIIVSGIYYPCVVGTGWADGLLQYTGYNVYPYKAQALIREIYSEAIGCMPDIIYVPLYEVLDCYCEEDYVARVEPSSQGGRKMASAFKKHI